MTNRPSEFTVIASGVVALCFLIGMVGRMIPEHFPNLVGPMAEEFGWGRSQIASIFSVCALITGLSGPLAGLLFDRLGPKWLYASGFTFAGGGLIIASQANALWQFYAGLGVFVGFAGACCGNVSNSALVSRWFRDKLPLALSLIFSALGAGSFVGLSLSQILISQYGWRSAEFYMGLGILMLIPVLLILPWRRLTRGRRFNQPKKTTNSAITEESWSLQAAIKTPGFWGLASVFFITANGMYSVIIQSVTYLVERGMSPVESSFNIGLTGLLIPIGMVSCGYLLTRFNNIVVALGTYVLTIGGVLFLWQYSDPSRYWAVIGFILFFGLTMGTRGPVVGSLAARIFHGPNFGVIYGCITVGGGIGAASGTFFSGWIYDITGSYEAVFSFSLTCLAAGALPFFVVPVIRKQGRIGTRT